jgi:micrococcal nuclease
LGIFLENKIKQNVSKIDFNNLEIGVTNPPSFENYGEAKERAVVKRVIDGDTIELNDGRKVRYIGINSPEMTDKRKDVLCFANMAKEENQRLVLGKTVEMEKDVSDKDKYDRLLRYVWVDGEMVNLILIKNGYVKIATYPPDVKYKEMFLEASKLAPKLICNKI